MMCHDVIVDRRYTEGPSPAGYHRWPLTSGRFLVRVDAEAEREERAVKSKFTGEQISVALNPSRDPRDRQSSSDRWELRLAERGSDQKR